jgi:hypothetical protein
MSSHAIRASEKDSLARFLGWFSVGLGTVQAAAPRALCTVVGASTKGKAPTIMRLMGLRELAHGVGILARPRPAMWLWSRVAGDALDLGLLGLNAARRPDGRRRTAFAIVNVLALAVPDVREARHLSRRQGEPRSGKLVRKAVTINRSREEVEQRWRTTELAERIEAAGASVRFDEAPGDRGTELAVEFVHDPPAGDLGAVFEKVTARDLATRLADELRLLKQQLETGEIVRSDSTPDGHRLSQHLTQRAAQPLEEANR